MADEEKQLPDNDDWLNDFNNSTDTSEAAGAGQADFDELFDSFESGQHGAGGNSESSRQSGGEIVEEEELDQASIDALFGGSGAASPAPGPEFSGGAPESLDQSTIGDLLGDGGDESIPETGAELFGEATAVSPFEVEAVDFEEVLGTGDAGEEFSGSELDDEFDFGEEILDPVEEDGILQAVDETPLDDLFADEGKPKPQPSVRDISEEPTVLSSTVKAPAARGRASLRAKMASIDQKKAAIAVFGLLLLLGAVGLIMNSISHRGSEPAIRLPDQEDLAAGSFGQPATGKGSPGLVNLPPEAKSHEFSFAAEASQVEILLEASDPEGAKLTFEVSDPPEYGRLSGEPPLLVYHADSKFSGKDRFEFRASDGSQASQPAVISISGPDIAARLAEPVVIEPKQLVLKVVDQELAGMSTEPIIIDWRNIWSQENAGSMKNVAVEISAEGLKGKLTRLDSYRHRYEPDPFSEGREVFKFRFKKRGVASKQRKMELQVASGNPPPALLVAELDKARYAIGDMVVIDASGSRDDKRASLVFEWRQVAGVPVYFNRLNEEGSRVSFIMPSSFYTTDYPEPVIQLTAEDVTGKVASREIRVALQRESFRQAALWDGLQDGRVVDPEYPDGICPGSRVP